MNMDDTRSEKSVKSLKSIKSAKGSNRNVDTQRKLDPQAVCLYTLLKGVLLATFIHPFPILARHRDCGLAVLLGICPLPEDLTSNWLTTLKQAEMDGGNEMFPPNSEDELAEEFGELSEGGEQSDEELEIAGEIEINFIEAQVAKHLTRYIKRRVEDLQILRIKLQSEPLVPQNLTDEQLIIYLFTARYNIAATVTLIRSNYKLRVMLPNLFTSRLISAMDISDVWHALRTAPFPVRHADQQHVVYIGIRHNTQPENLDAHYAMKLLLMCADVYHILEGIPCSFGVIVDAEGASYGYFTQKNYEYLKILVKYVQECMPYNVDAVHVVNSTALIKSLYKFIRPFLTKEIIRTIFFHKHPQDLLKVFRTDVLPAELGGTCPGTIDEYQTKFREKMERMQDFFEMEEEQRANRYFEQKK